MKQLSLLPTRFSDLGPHANTTAFLDRTGLCHSQRTSRTSHPTYTVMIILAKHFPAGMRHAQAYIQLKEGPAGLFNSLHTALKCGVLNFLSSTMALTLILMTSHV